MLFKSIVLAGFAATALTSVVFADDTYRCGDQRCYDDQAEETRRLNLEQLEDHGYRDDRDDADSSYGDQGYDNNDRYGSDPEGQGGPYEPLDEDDPQYTTDDQDRYAPEDSDDSYGDDTDADLYMPEDEADDDPDEAYPYRN